MKDFKEHHRLTCNGKDPERQSSTFLPEIVKNLKVLKVSFGGQFLPISLYVILLQYFIAIFSLSFQDRQCIILKSLKVA